MWILESSRYRWCLESWALMISHREQSRKKRACPCVKGSRMRTYEGVEREWPWGRRENSKSVESKWIKCFWEIIWADLSNAADRSSKTKMEDELSKMKFFDDLTDLVCDGQTTHWRRAGRRKRINTESYTSMTPLWEYCCCGGGYWKREEIYRVAFLSKRIWILY